MKWNEMSVAGPTANGAASLTSAGAPPAARAGLVPQPTSASPAVQHTSSVNPRWRLGAMVGRSAAMERLFLQMRYLANHLRIAMIEGEPGTGKLLAARTLHTLATRRTEGFVPCSAKAFFLGGESARALEESRGGTLYLTRVDALSVAEQGKLLQLLEWLQHQHTRNGDQAPKQLLVSCERPLRGLVLQGVMRADVSYHLTSVRLQLPPLRDRRDDMPVLVDHFLELFSKRHGKPLRGVAAGVLPHLLGHAWPGNVRELETTIYSAAMLCEGQYLRLIDLPLLSLQAPQSSLTAPSQDHGHGSAVGGGSGTKGGDKDDSNDPNLDRAILRHIRKVLASVNGNKLRAARLLGISRSTLYRLLEGGSSNSQSE